LAIELFKLKAGIDFKIVHFKGGSPAITDLLGGHSDATMSSLTQVWPHIKSGKLKVLATGGKTRSVFLPDVPTMEEAGVPGYEAAQWFGILAPAGTPAPIVERLDKEIKTILTRDEVKKQFLNAASEVNYLGSKEFGQFIERDIALRKFVVEKANIQIKK
jgi:tripartite-type tricarboxylate transporter receptor subunit TctC